MTTADRLQRFVLRVETSISDGFFNMILGVLELAGIARAQLADCPKCGETMKRVRRKPPRGPYYMDFAHYCEHCDHEVEADHILPRANDENY